MGARIIGAGSYLPGNPISNDALAKIVPEVDSEWIVSRTGITQRYFAEQDEFTSHLAFAAAQNAILSAKITPETIDLIIVATTTPDNTFPSVACKLQSLLCIKKTIPAFDIQAVCAGFVYGLEIANNFMLSGKYKRILLIGADKMSSVLDMNSKNCSVLFGDGAGAVILESSEESEILASKIYSDGSLSDILYTNGGASSSGSTGFVHMQGKEVFRHAIEKMSESILDVLNAANIKADDVDFLIPHQANVRIIDGISNKLNFPNEKIIKTIDKHANCSAASIPLALVELISSGNLQRGDLIMLTALGAGLTWGSMLIRW
ncbi:MAG: 3-oxoacyl-[acyl-carrier-protein] synthase 3 [Pseudomonadota bacterium]|jgi:3-oxoacyl-[acyl-carrier-protein] synthase-3